MHGMRARGQARAPTRADRADRPFFPICNANVPGRNVTRHVRRVGAHVALQVRRSKLEGRSGAAAPSGVARVPTCTRHGGCRVWYYGSVTVYISTALPGTFTLHIGKNGRVGATGTAPRVRVRRRYQERVLSAHGFAPRPRCVSDHLLSRCFAAGEVSSRELLNMARGRRPTPPPLPASPRASAPNP